VIASARLTRNTEGSDFLTVGAPALCRRQASKRSLFPVNITRIWPPRINADGSDVEGPDGDGFNCSTPQGAYYIMADFGKLSTLNDSDFTKYLVRHRRCCRSRKQLLP